MPFRQMPDDVFKRECKLEIIYCAATYLGIPENKEDKEVLNECVRFVKERFSFIGSGEIRQAFSMCSAGELDVQLRAYFGMLTVDLFGKVLSAYREFRKAEVAEIEKMKDAELQKANEAIIEQKKLEAQAQMRKEIGEALAGIRTFDEWEKIPTHWAKFAIQEGIIQYSPEEKLFIYEEALELARESKVRAKQNASSEGRVGDARAIHNFLDKLAKGEPSAEAEIKAIAENIYSKLIIYKKLPINDE